MNSDVSNYGYSVEARGSVDEVAQRVSKGLSASGYGVLSTIDLRRIIKEKLGEDMEGYVLLDVCKPKYAKAAIDKHKEVGLVLPCKITVLEDKKKTWISLYRPTFAIGSLGLSDLESLAEQVEMELKQIIDLARGM